LPFRRNPHAGTGIQCLFMMVSKPRRLAGQLTVFFPKYGKVTTVPAKPLAGARGSVPSHDRKEVAVCNTLSYLPGALGAFLLAAAMIILCSCVHRGGAAIAAYTEQKKLLVRGDCPQSSDTCSPFKPIEADQYASEQYDHYRESGFVTLRPDMRLRVVAPIVREGGSAAPLVADASPNGDSGTASITLKSSGNLLGYETAIYSLIPGRAGELSVQLDDMSVKPVAAAGTGALERRDLLEALPKNVCLRLYFQLRHSMKDHSAVLLMAKTLGGLNEASGEFEENPDAFCATPHNDAHCLAFPKFTAVTAEVKVHVRKRDVYVPISANLREAILAYGDVDPQAISPHVKLERLWNARVVPVHFDKKSVAILSLPVVAGDRITW
jgi:hypothetical protein